MSFVGEPEQQLILDLMTGRIDAGAFNRTYPLEPGQDGSEAGLAMLVRAVQERDREAVELGLLLAGHFGYFDEYRDVLVDLAYAPWHHRHEDIVSMLEEMDAPGRVEPLYAMAIAKFPYRHWDDSASLGRKCLHALARMATPEAVARLRDLTTCDDEILRVKAAKRLAEMERAGVIGSGSGRP